MRPGLALVSALAALVGACDGGPGPEGTIEYRVSQYEVEVDLLARTSTVGVIADIETGGDCLSIPSRLAPTGARWDGGEPSSGTYEDGQITLCGSGIQAGGHLRFEVDVDLVEDTWEDLQVGYSITQDIEGAPFHYLVSWIGGCDRFGPCDAAPDQFASYRFEVTHAPADTVLCSGTITRDPGFTVCDTEFVAPTYSAYGMAASPSWTEVALGTWGGLDVTFYDMPTSSTASRVQGDVHDQFIEFLEERLGPYAYGTELRIAVGPTVWNGFEHPGNIVLNDDLRNDPLGGGYSDRLTHTINHEIAHMWAGNRTTLASERDFMWKEATVEYLTYVFEDEVLGTATSTQTTRAWKNFGRDPSYFPVPTGDAALIDYYGDAYGPGPMVLYRQLEALYDRESVMAAVAAVLQPETAISVDDIQAALEAELGADLSGYFATWVRGNRPPAWPRFAVTYTQDGNDVAVQVAQTAPEQPMGCAFAVQLRSAGGAETADVWFDRGLDGELESAAAAKVGFTVESVALDPYGDCLAYPSTAAFEPASRTHPWRAH